MHRRLVSALPPRPNVTFHDLYEAYPSFDIDVSREQELLTGHDLFVLQHPFFWYSTPPLLKQWIDLVLEHGWAYGSRGTALRGKRVLSLISAGGGSAAYEPGGYNRFTMRQLLAPVEQTARLCGMVFLPPYVIFGTHRFGPEDIDKEMARYAALLTALAEDRIDFEPIADEPLLNPALDALMNEQQSP